MNTALLILATFLFGQVPIPESSSLIKEIESHQRRMDEIRENYTFHEVTVTDDLDAKGAVEQTSTGEREVFFVNGYRVARLVRKNGRELSQSENRDELDRVRKLVEKDMKAPPGHSYYRRGENVSIGQILPLMKISSPKRIMVNGRTTLVFDFTGDPHAKAHGLAENAARKIMGTVWIDETDREVARLEAHFDDNFRIGAGLLASIQRGTSLTFEQSPLGDNLWMPVVTEIHLAARELMVRGVRQNIHIKNDDFRRFDVGILQQIAPPIQ